LRTTTEQAQIDPKAKKEWGEGEASNTGSLNKNGKKQTQGLNDDKINDRQVARLMSRNTQSFEREPTPSLVRKNEEGVDWGSTLEENTRRPRFHVRVTALNW